MNNQYAKSCIRVYNNTAQAFTAALTPLNLEGTPVVNSGCSLTLNTASIRVNKSGLYHLAADVTYTPTAAGVVILQLYKDGGCPSLRHCSANRSSWGCVYKPH